MKTHRPNLQLSCLCISSGSRAPSCATAQYWCVARLGFGYAVGLQALRRKPDYPEVLECRARIFEENFRFMQEWRQDEEDARAHEEGLELARERREAEEAEDEEERRAHEAGLELARQREEAEEAEDEEDRRAHEARLELVRERLVQAKRRQEERREIPREGLAEGGQWWDAEGGQWWQDEQDKVAQQRVDEMKREQEEREAEYRRAQVRMQEKAMSRFKLAAERQREAAANKAEKIRYLGVRLIIEICVAINTTDMFRNR